MFDIEYKGANCIAINTKNSSLILDPKLSLVGLKDASVKDKIEIVTEERFKVNGDQKVIFDYPGEYEIGDFSIKGVPARRHIDAPDEPMIATIYRVQINEVKIAILGNIAAGLSDEQLEDLGMIDILIIPVGGGGYTLGATDATHIARQVEAKVTIPIHYADSGVKYEVPQDDLELFQKEMGVEVETVEGKYKLKTASALPENNVIMVLSRN